MLDLKVLKYFIAAYEEQSVTAAAQRCHIAQPSITTAIHNLEAELGVRLFERSRRGLAATAEGKSLYPKAKNLLAESNAILHGFKQLPQRELRLQIQDDLLMRRAGGVIRALLGRMPDAKLRIVGNGEASDLRLVSEHCKRAGEWMQVMWEEEYVVIMPADHPLRFKQAFGLQDFHRVPFIERPYCAMYEMLAQTLGREKIELDIRASAAREEAVLALVECGVGMAVVPESHCKDVQNIVVRPLKHGTGVKRRVGLACADGDIDMVTLIREMRNGV